jgi:hypothetical protein
MKIAIAISTIAVGILLLLASSLWSTIFPATNAWTEEKSQRHIEVQTRLSNLGPIVNTTTPTMHRGPDPATLKAEFDALVKENQQLNAEFEAARDGPETKSSILKWTGIALAVAGLFGWYGVKQSS